MRKHIQLIALLFICAFVFLCCINNLTANNLKAGLTPPPVKLNIQDPNEAPYQMFVAAYQQETQLFKFNLPDGEILTNTDTLIQIKLLSKKDGPSKTLSISVAPGACNTTNSNIDAYTEPTRWSTINLGTQTYNRGTTGLKGVYPTYIYAWQQNSYCFTFSFQFQTDVAFENEPPPPAFNSEKEEKTLKAMLQTIVFKKQ